MSASANLKDVIRDDLAAALRDALFAVGADPPEVIALERPTHKEHGDWSSNVALVTARSLGRNPRDLAQRVADALNEKPPFHVTAVEVAGPGFVNFRLARALDPTGGSRSHQG